MSASAGDLGIRLTGTAADAAVLDRLLAADPQWLAGPWSVSARSPEGYQAWRSGLTPVPGLEMEPVAAPALREAAHLFEVLAPVALPDDPLPAVVRLVVPAGDRAAVRTVTRLLRLGRVDVTLAQWRDGGVDHVVIEVVDPPLYVLLRARDDEEPVRAFARHREGPLWVEWGFAHPLADLAADRLRAAEQAAFVDRQGRWRAAPVAWQGQPITGAIDARLPAVERRLEPSTAEPPRFAVHLRLEADRDRPATLWILDADGFAGLEPMVDTSPAEVLDGVTVARLESAGGVRYVLRVRAAGGDSLAERLAGILPVAGFVRVPGADRIFVPAGRRLMPPMQVETLRRVLDLDRAATMVVREGPDGVERVRIADGPEAPLSRWVDYVALDRRTVLDALLEESVFAVARLRFDRPVQTRNDRAHARPPKRTPKRRRPVIAPSAEAPRTEAEAVRAARLEAAPLQAVVVAGGCVDATIWGRLGVLLERLSQPDDAAFCYEAAAFHADGAAQRGVALAALSTLRTALAAVPDAGVAEALVEAATKDQPSPIAVAFLGARAAHDVDRGALLDGLVGPLVTRFGQSAPACSRRLAWLVLHGLHAQRADALGSTRAKEVLLGALNTDGLREAYDAPRFARLALALGAGEDIEGDGGDQRGSLGVVWDGFGSGLDELEAQGALYRAIFAIGFARAGDRARAAAVARPLEEELAIHDPPVRALLQLYLARLEVQGASEEAAEDTWRSALDAALSPLERRHRRMLEFARKRSAWLAEGTGPRLPSPRVPGAPSFTGAVAMGPLRALAKTLDGDATAAAKVLADATNVPGTFDYQLAELTRQALRAALGTGRDAVLAETLTWADLVIATLRIPSHRATALGAAISGAALAGDDARVHRLLDEIVALLPQIDAVGEALGAIGPAMGALRRIGLSDAAEGFLESLQYVADRGHRESAKVAVFVADGHRLLGDAGGAEKALRFAEMQMLDHGRNHVARFEAAAVLFETLRGWPVAARETVALRVLGRLDGFRDMFSTRRYFELHKVMVVERVVDALSDTRTFASGRLRLWLEGEEQSVRGRIVADWKTLAG